VSLIVDIVVGLQSGDEGKGKVTHHLLQNGKYTHCVRFNGGGNAGHTIYHNGKKFVTHLIPSGVFFGIKSIIGPGCVINIDKFLTEIEELWVNGIDVDGLIYISKNAHIVQEKHLTEDSTDVKIGTTKTGNGPAYTDKYHRTGMRAEQFDTLKPFLIDFYEEMHNNGNVEALFEGAQGFELDIDWGDYPFVTSSHCTTAGAMLNGIPPNSVRNIWGVAKAYETYVGAKQFQPKKEIFNKIQELGKEFGATTGRKRQCNWLDLNKLKRSVNINGVTHIVLNKVDILEQLDFWKIMLPEGTKTYTNSNKFEEDISNFFKKEKIFFSRSPEFI
jgi:adenylosuccinate synthase